MGSLAPRIGVDIGQKHDPTAVCVSETQSRNHQPHLVVRHLERLPLGTPYPRVADRIADIAQRVLARTGKAPTVCVDATGVGQPVIDLLRERNPRQPIVAVTFTHGRGCRWKSVDRVSLGKERLVCQLQALLRSGRLHLPAGPESEALSAELLNYEIRVGRNARARFGAFRSGTHDDLVTALGLTYPITQAGSTG
ncbi:MAG: hypothetical protein AAFY88_05510 [Acidobacteriota bacterium]